MSTFGARSREYPSDRYNTCSASFWIFSGIYSYDKVTLLKLSQNSSMKEAEKHLFIYDWTNPVFWAHVSVLEADLSCLRSLVVIGSAEREEKRWKFYMNMAGSELSLKTIPEMQDILKGVKDWIGQDVGVLSKGKDQHRLWRRFRIKRTGFGKFDFAYERDFSYPRTKAPFGLTVLKGSRYVVMSFDKSEFLVRHPVCIKYYNWIQDIFVPDESFFQTLLVISKVEKVDGKWKVTQDLKMKIDKHCPRTSLWYYSACQGKLIRKVCNVGAPDLKKLRSEGCFVGNKFNLDVDATAVLCQLKELVGQNLKIQKDNKTYYNKIFWSIWASITNWLGVELELLATVFLIVGWFHWMLVLSFLNSISDTVMK